MEDYVYKALFVYFVFLFCLPSIILGAFDFYLLSLQWPPGYCYRSVPIANPCKQPFPRSFTIHGLWPQNNNFFRQYRPCPQAPPFNLNEVTNDPQLNRTMNTLWPNLKGLNEDFWEHEWTKHGTCTTFTQHDYFQTTCDLALRRNKLLAELKNNGMVPGGSYRLNDYMAAIKSAYNVTPQIACNKPSGTWPTSNTVQMFEIRFCVDSSTKDFINCNRSASWRCRNSAFIAFPSEYPHAPAPAPIPPAPVPPVPAPIPPAPAPIPPAPVPPAPAPVPPAPAPVPPALVPVPPVPVPPAPIPPNQSIAVGLGGYFQFWVAVKILVLSLVFEYICF